MNDIALFILCGAALFLVGAVLGHLQFIIDHRYFDKCYDKMRKQNLAEYYICRGKENYEDCMSCPYFMEEVRK